MAKVKAATDWLDICSGCHMAFLDIDERMVVSLHDADRSIMP